MGVKYYLAAPLGAKRRDEYLELGFGLLYSPTYGIIPRQCEDFLFALDNGAFSAYRGRVPWDETRFYRYVQRIENTNITPAFVVIPDIVAGGKESLDLSVSHIQKLPSTWKKYLPVQDGMKECDLTPNITEYIDGIFVGGIVTWKWRTAGMWCKLAHDFGFNCHIGRVNTEREILSAYHIDADSVDGSSASRNRTELKLLRNILSLQTQKLLSCRGEGSEQEAPPLRAG